MRLQHRTAPPWAASRSRAVWLESGPKKKEKRKRKEAVEGTLQRARRFSGLFEEEEEELEEEEEGGMQRKQEVNGGTIL